MPEGQCKDNTFHYRCKGKCPPDTIKAHSHMSQQHGKRYSGPCQNNTDDTAELGHTKAGQCTDGHQLNGHESLTEADDDQVIYRNPKGFRIMEKQTGDRAWEQHKGYSYDKTPDCQDTKGNTVALADAVVFFCTEILCGKSI